MSPGLAGLPVCLRHVSHRGGLHRDGERRDRPAGERGFVLLLPFTHGFCVRGSTSQSSHKDFVPVGI